MTIEGCDSLDDAIEELRKLQGYAPYRYSGVWHVSQWLGAARCYRSKQTLLAAAAREGQSEIAYAVIKPQQ